MDSGSCKREVQEPRPLKSLAFNVKDSNGNNLLHRFVLNNCTSNNENYITPVLRSLFGVSVNDVNSKGYTALHLAVREISYLMVRKLLSSVPTIDVNLKSLHGEKTALHLAAASSTGEEDAATIVRCLISSGADSNAKDDDCNSPLHVSVEKKNLEIVKVLIEGGANVDICNLNSHTPLLIAAKNGCFEIVRVLIEGGADVNGCNNRNGDTPLHIATLGPGWGLLEKKRHLKTLKVLLEKGAVIDCRNKYGNTPLHLAVDIKHSVKYLVERGAVIDIYNEKGYTPLYVAAEKGRFRVVRILIEEGADINSCSKKGDTPLHVAAQNGCFKIVRVLIEGGADVNRCNRKGDTPLHMATQGPPWGLLDKKRNLKTIKVLLEMGAVIDCRNKYGDTPLHMAADIKHSVICKYLVERGAVIDCRNLMGNTPLHKAVYQGNFETIKFLVESGAVVECRNENHDTPLNIALKFVSIEKKIVRFLEESVSSKRDNSYEIPPPKKRVKV